ncbi:MAG TPA: DUF4142 domain-containing protein, partial [Chryseosolibacter sp.]|nr:DUF4142 domain-containing protein [Chryseosolibacter sp.]
FYEHGLALHDLRQLAKNYNNVDLPTDLDSVNREAKDTLGTLTGSDFNIAYARYVLESNQKIKTLYENAANSASDARLKEFAAKYLSMMTQNVQDADSLVRMMEPEPEPTD